MISKLLHSFISHVTTSKT